MLSAAASRKLAILIGLLLPVAETVRRLNQFGQWWAWIDDYLIGAALLSAAWYSRHADDRGNAALAAAWGMTAGMGYYSFVGHLLHAGETDISSLPGWMITTVIGAGFLLACYAALSAIAATQSPPPNGA